MNKKYILSLAILIGIALGWGLVISSGSGDNKAQLELLEQARSYIEDKIYIKGLPLYEDALTYKTERTPDIFLEYANVFKEMNDFFSYRELMKQFLLTYEASEEVYLEVAKYDFENNYYSDGFKVVKEGLLKFNSEKLQELYETYRYSIQFSYAEYDDITLLSNNLIAAKRGDKWGYISGTGKTVISFDYDQAMPFIDDLAIARQDNQAILIDTEGNRWALAKESVEDIIPMSSERSALKIDNKWYVTNSEFLVGDISYNFVGTLSEGYFVIETEAGVGLRDIENNFIVSIGANEIAMDELGRALVNNRAFIKVNEKFQMIDEKGNYIGIQTYEDAFPFYLEGQLAAVKQNGKWGFIDENGKEVLPYEWENAKSFSCGVAAVQRDGLWGFIDFNGELIINPQFVDVKSFVDGVASVYDGFKWRIMYFNEYRD